VTIPFLASADAYRQAGLHMEAFASGRFKGIGLPGLSLTDEQRGLLQGEVEEIFADFRAAVLTRGRKIPDRAMEGQTFSARQAQRHNLASVAKDRDAVLARLRRLHGTKLDTVARSIPHAPMKNVEDQLAETIAQIKSLEARAGERDQELGQLAGLLGEARASLEAKEADLSWAAQPHAGVMAELNRSLHSERASRQEQLAAAGSRSTSSPNRSPGWPKPTPTSLPASRT
jgi:ClpP class serine protease